MSNTLKIVLTIAALCLVVVVAGRIWSYFQETQPAKKTAAAVTAAAARREADRQAQRRPDSLGAALAGQRAENARTSTTNQRTYDSLLRIRRRLPLPAVPPREQ